MTKAHDKKFHVFLSHNSKNKRDVKAVKQKLEKQALKVWDDEDQLRPGIPWEERLESGIKSSASVAVVVGKDGIGPWENEEMKAALRLAVKDKRPIIPVLLPGAPTQPKPPMFLGNRTWVDLRGGISIQSLEKLIWGITGIRHNIGVIPSTGTPQYEGPLASKNVPSQQQASRALGGKRPKNAKASQHATQGKTKRRPGVVLVLKNPFSEGSLTEFLGGARSALLIGHSLKTQIDDTIGELKGEIARLGKRLRIVVLDPRLPNLSIVARNYGFQGDMLKEDITMVLRRLREHGGVSASAIRLSQTVPCVNTYLRTGPKRSTAICGLYLCGVNVFKRPYIEVNSDDPNRELYERVEKHAEALWKDATRITRKELDLLCKQPLHSRHLAIQIPHLAGDDVRRFCSAVQNCVVQEAGTASGCQVVS